MATKMIYAFDINSGNMEGVYDNAFQAAKETNQDPALVYKVLAGKRNRAKNYFYYLSDEPIGEKKRLEIANAVINFRLFSMTHYVNMRLKAKGMDK